MLIRFLLLLTLAPVLVMADTVSYSSSTSTGVAAAVDLEILVGADGSQSMDVDQSQLSDGSAWSIYSGVTISIPPNSVINSATFQFDNPAEFTSYDGNGLVLQTDVQSALNSVSLSGYCSDNNFLNIGPVPVSGAGSISFLPCSSSMDLGVGFSGTTDIEITGSEFFPSSPAPAPGIYNGEAYAFDSINFTVSVDYTPASVAPEPAMYPVLGTGLFAVLAIGYKRHSYQKSLR
jgi:hypothetical protein